MSRGIGAYTYESLINLSLDMSINIVDYVQASLLIFNAFHLNQYATN
jgi:hypothetical protein